MLVAAALRVAMSELIDCVVLRRGNAEAGAILVHIDRLDGNHRLLRARWNSTAAMPGGRWSAVRTVMAGRTRRCRGRLARELEIDPDAYVWPYRTPAGEPFDLL